MVASVVYALDGTPIESWPVSIAWLVLLVLLSFLMVSTWRYQSFKDTHWLRPRSPLPLMLLVVCIIFALQWYTESTLLALTTVYVSSGIVIRIGGILRRRLRHTPPEPERQIG